MDQAQGLRELVARFNAGDPNVRYVKEHDELTLGAEFKKNGFEILVDRALPAGEWHMVSPDTNIDKAKLWDQFKAELSAEADRCTGDQIRGYAPTHDATKARAMLDRMEQAETFARVRDQLAVRHG